MLPFSFRMLILALPLLLSSVLAPAQANRPTTTTHVAQEPAALDRKVYLPLSIHLYDPTYINPFGVVIYANVDATTGLAHMQSVGAKRVTTILDWGTVQPTEQTWDWSVFDAKVTNAKAAGMEVFALMTGDPAWAWQPDRRSTIPEKRINFVRAMIQRYDCDGSNDAPGRLCVHDWSFYAEPDFYVDYLQDDPGSKGYWGERGAAYAHMLADVANVVHGEDASARVMIGGIAYDAFLPPGGGDRGFVKAFLPTVLATLNTKPGGARAYLDAMAVHYYPLQFTSIISKITEIRTIMQAHNVAALPILVPETGYWSAPSEGSSEAKQAQKLTQIFVEGLAAGVHELSYFTVFDSADGRESSGLFHGQDLNRPKLAYSAYRVVTTELAGARYSRLLGQTGVTGYVFRMPQGTEKTVFWGTNAAGSAVFGGRCLRVVDELGVANTVNDGGPGDGDGVINGQIRVAAAANDPVYVEACR